MGIAGDPAALYAAADEMAATGRDFFEAADAIAAHGRAVTSNWFGDASEAAGRHIEGLSRRVQVGSEVYAGAARAIRTYAGELAAAQDAWGEAAGRAATAAADLAGAQRASAAAAAMVTTDAVGHPDPGAEAAQARAAGEAAGALSAAGAAGNAAREDMDAAVAAALAANQRAADAINACCDQLADMGGQPSAAATSLGADLGAGRVGRDASSAAPSGTASAGGSSTGLSNAEVIASAALQTMTPFWLVGGVDLSEAPGDVVRDQVGGLGEAAWDAGPGAVGWALGLTGGKLDAAASDEITKVHDWLQKWWGADTTSSAYKNEKLAGDVAGLFVGGGKVRDTAEFGKVVLQGFKDGAAEKGLAETVEALPGRTRVASEDLARDVSETAHYVNVASDKRTIHILYGDETGGGHMPPGMPGKSLFPEDWSAEKIMHHVSDVATDPEAAVEYQKGAAGSLYTRRGYPSRYIATSVREGVKIQVVVEPAGEGVISAWPILP